MRLFLVALAFFLLLAPGAKALSFGGVGDPAAISPEKGYITKKGRAVAPENAPAEVKKVIRAANKIRHKPYIWGGGHGMSGESWPIKKGYDCSGAVSYALWGGGFVQRSRTSGEYLSWGKRGRGDWITLWTNKDHIYMVVAGLRFDTAGGKGPRWHKDKRSNKGFVPRFIEGF